jgi:lipopolysaccharide/colanic/teichoic acid biosynthesis glycosyltransferase
MIVLGEEHHFSDLERESLRKHFDTIDFVHYKDMDVNTVIEHMESCTAEHAKSTIVLNTQARIPNELISYLTKLEQRGIRYISIENFLERYLYKCYIPEEMTKVDFLENIKPFRKDQLLFKFILDYFSAFVLGLAYLIALPFAKKKIHNQSPGKLLFVQNRVGLNNHEFSCVKFRSMRLNAEEEGAQFAKEDDDRIFPWGKTMRKYRIDELPQFFNVIKRDMHLVGPRPERKYWIDQFEKEIPYYNTRHIIRPGITGWAQVMYPYGANAVDAKQKLMYDLYYIKHWSPWLEIRILWKTIMVVLGKQGR